MYTLIFITLALLATDLLAAERSKSFTVVLMPSSEPAMMAAYVEPFGKSTGVNINDYVYDGHTDILSRIVRSGKPVWGDVVQVEGHALAYGCLEGLFERLDISRIDNRKDFVPGAITECGVANFAWSQAFVYDSDKVAGTPESWADFWDVKKFPGKRGLRRSAKYTLEFALLADGVAPADVYKVLATSEGVDRAFRKLDEIRPEVVWWEAAGQAPIFLETGKVVMTSSYTSLVGETPKAKIVWNGSLHDFDSFAIPKGTPSVDEAYRFIAFASRPENQKVFVEGLAYGPTNKKTLAILDSKLASTLPTAETNLKGALAIDVAFWTRNGVELEKRFERWAPAGMDKTYDQLHRH